MVDDDKKSCCCGEEFKSRRSCVGEKKALSFFVEEKLHTKSYCIQNIGVVAIVDEGCVAFPPTHFLNDVVRYASNKKVRSASCT